MCIYTVSSLVDVASAFVTVGRPYATVSVTKCEKDGKAYAEIVHWVPESEQGLKHLTEREDRVVSQDGHSMFCKPLRSYTHQSHRRLDGLETTFSLSVFASIFASVS